MPEIRLEGLTLRVADVKRSIEFYSGKLGLCVEIDKAPQFAMIHCRRADRRYDRAARA
jgi:catechol 2,3-dioxygenase-like lactoylglutathione lyase family enzyme